MNPSHYLCSFTPLGVNPAGRAAAQAKGLPLFIDGSCRREPDFENPSPSISALCRAGKFAPRLVPGDRVAYITTRSGCGGEIGWRLVSLLRVARRFESHQAGALWYRDQGLPLPSNCLVPGNGPKPFEMTHGRAPKEILRRVDAGLHPEHVIRLWDATYAKRAAKHRVLLSCETEFSAVDAPPLLTEADLMRIFCRVPGTQNPPKILPQEYSALAAVAGSHKRDGR